tara:strand:+ start:3436 stop:3648 length:213 start_codon:yes stop_codon:yes gene_type:complete
MANRGIGEPLDLFKAMVTVLALIFVKGHHRLPEIRPNQQLPTWELVMPGSSIATVIKVSPTKIQKQAATT